MLRNGRDSGLDWIWGTVYLGMIVAVISTNSSAITNLPSWQRLQTLIPLESDMAIPIFVLFQASRENEASSYDNSPPFISNFPFLSFIVLRNSATRLRNTDSTAFAVIRRCSQEMCMRAKFYRCPDCWDSWR
jgi:hypothetical protein